MPSVIIKKKLVLLLLEKGANPSIAPLGFLHSAWALARDDTFFDDLFKVELDFTKGRRVIKSLRPDEFNFDLTKFIPGTTRHNKNKKRIPLLLRPKKTKRFSLYQPIPDYPKNSHYTNKYVHETKNKPRKYPKEVTKDYSGPQSVSLVSPDKKIDPNPFGFGAAGQAGACREKNYGVSVLINKSVMLDEHSFYRDTGTVFKRYQFRNANLAHEYAKKRIFTLNFSDTDYPPLWFDVDDLENNLKNGTQKERNHHTEILARLKLDKENWRIFIGKDNLESKLLAQNLERRLREELEQIHLQNHFPWDEDYRIPIYYHIAGNTKHNTRYTIFEQADDRNIARGIAENQSERHANYTSKNFEFLLGLPPSKIADLLINENISTNLFIFLLGKGYVHIAQVLLERTQKSMSDLLQQIKLKCVVSSATSTYQDALYHCARNGDAKLVDWLLSLDWKGNAYTVDQNTLAIACKNGNLDAVKCLIKQPEFINQMKNGSYQLPRAGDRKFCKNFKTPLMIAARYGHLEIVKKLIKAGAPINAIKDSKNTAFMYAAKAGRVEVVEYFLKKHRNDIDLKQKNHSGKDALVQAIENGRPEIAQILLKQPEVIDHLGRGCITDPVNAAKNNDDVTTIKSLLNLYENEKILKDINFYFIKCLWLEWDSRTKKHDDYKQLKDYFSSIKKTLDNDGKYSDFCKDLKTHAYDFNRPGIVELLLDLDDTLDTDKNNKPIGVNDSYNDGPLAFACEFGHFDLAKKLITAGANINENIFVAARFEHDNIVKLLITHGASPSSNADTLKYIQKFPIRNKALIELCEMLKTKTLDKIIYEAIKHNDLSRIEGLLTDLNIKSPYPNNRTGVIDTIKKLSAHYNPKMFEKLIVEAYGDDNSLIIPDLIALGAEVNLSNHILNIILHNKSNFLSQFLKYAKPDEISQVINAELDGILSSNRTALLECILKHVTLNPDMRKKIIDYVESKIANWNLLKPVLLNIDRKANQALFDHLIFIALKHNDKDSIAPLFNRKDNDPTAKNSDNLIAIEVALINKKNDFVECLLLYYPDALTGSDLAKQYGRSLVSAVRFGQYKIAINLLNKGAVTDFNYSKTHHLYPHCTPLLIAIKHSPQTEESAQLISLLLQKKARIIDITDINLSAISIAKEHKNYIALKLIIEHRHKELNTAALKDILKYAVENKANDIVPTIINHVNIFSPEFTELSIVYGIFYSLNQYDEKAQTQHAITYLKSLKEKLSLESFMTILNAVYNLSRKNGTLNYFNGFLTFSEFIDTHTLSNAIAASCEKDDSETLKKQLDACTTDTFNNNSRRFLEIASINDKLQNAKILIARGAGFKDNIFETHHIYNCHHTQRKTALYIYDFSDKSLEQIVLKAIKNSDIFFVKEFCDNLTVKDAFFKRPELFYARFILLQAEFDLEWSKKDYYIRNEDEKKRLKDLDAKTREWIKQLKETLYQKHSPEQYNDFCNRLILLCSEFNDASLFDKILGSCVSDDDYKYFPRSQFSDIIKNTEPLMIAKQHGSANIVAKLIKFTDLDVRTTKVSMAAPVASAMPSNTPAATPFIFKDNNADIIKSLMDLNSQDACDCTLEKLDQNRRKKIMPELKSGYERAENILLIESEEWLKEFEQLGFAAQNLKMDSSSFEQIITQNRKGNCSKILELYWKLKSFHDASEKFKEARQSTDFNTVVNFARDAHTILKNNADKLGIERSPDAAKAKKVAFAVLNAVISVISGGLVKTLFHHRVRGLEKAEKAVNAAHGAFLVLGKV